MADFTLSASAFDKLLGAADIADNFVITAVGDLTGSDTIDGGLGNATVDVLRLQVATTLLAADFANVRNVERLVFDAGAASTVTLADAMVASAQPGPFKINSGAFGDSLVASEVVSRAISFYGNGGNDLFIGGGGADRARGGSGSDTLGGGAGNDTLSGGSGDDRLEGGDGDDLLDGGGGNDVYVLDSGATASKDRIADEAGASDRLEFTGGKAVDFSGSLAASVSGIEHIALGGGNDRVVLGNAMGDSVDTDVATVVGGEGDDLLDVGAIARLTAPPLSFVLDGGPGVDTLRGGAGNDVLDAGTGVGSLSGAGGDDLLIVHLGDLKGTIVLAGGTDGSAGDVLRLLGSGTVTAGQLAGVTGIETLELADGGVSIVVPNSLATGVSSSGVDLRVRAGADDDRIDLTALAAGVDVIVFAGDGDDTVIGAAGDDTVWAGPGIDTIQLGTGADRVCMAPGQLTALDTITADRGVAGDSLRAEVAAGRTLGSDAFAGVSGFDSFQFTGGAGAAVRLPAQLVSQSGLGSVSVSVNGTAGMAIDGRSVTGALSMSGNAGNDTLLGGASVDTLIGSSGEDTVVGGSGGDLITLSGTAERDLALIRSASDGTIDIDGTLTAAQLAAADRVSGTQLESNFIAADARALGLRSSATLFLAQGGQISMTFGANVLDTENEIAGNAFGSLTAVRDAVGARVSDGTSGIDRTILVIGGADETQFGVYYFEDRDNNATIDVADLLVLLAIGQGDVPTFGSNRGYTGFSADFL